LDHAPATCDTARDRIDGGGPQRIDPVPVAPVSVPRGIAGMREHIARVAVAGVPPEHWGIAISRMYLGLGVIFFSAVVFYFAQRYLGRKLQRGTPKPRMMRFNSFR